MRYLHLIKGFMLVYSISDDLDIVGYADSDFAGSLDDVNPH